MQRDIFRLQLGLRRELSLNKSLTKLCAIDTHLDIAKVSQAEINRPGAAVMSLVITGHQDKKHDQGKQVLLSKFRCQSQSPVIFDCKMDGYCQ
jgi:hypothetical protein